MEIPFIESSVVLNEDKRLITVFAVNCSLEDALDMEWSCENFGEISIIGHVELYADNLKAINTSKDQLVAPINKEVH